MYGIESYQKRKNNHYFTQLIFNKMKYSELVRNRGKYIEYMDRRKYRIREQLIYWIDYEHKNEYILIPK